MARPGRNGARLRRAFVGILALAGAARASASEISTHVLDLVRGAGGQGVPVLLLRQRDGGWIELARSVTDANGRIGSFGDETRFGPGLYKLQFDMSAYGGAGARPFFPEIDIVFRVEDGVRKYHVPVAISPYGYSTYRGN